MPTSREDMNEAHAFKKSHACRERNVNEAQEFKMLMQDERDNTYDVTQIDRTFVHVKIDNMCDARIVKSRYAYQDCGYVHGCTISQMLTHTERENM